ncbi:MAG: hypothetical protein U5N85_02690 [Arcicella sp.]|nr:hypothetical protein [Arcicella sp.]
MELGKIGIELDTISRTLCDGTTVMLNSRNFSGLVSSSNGTITGGILPMAKKTARIIRQW